MIIYRLSLFFTPVSFRWTIPLSLQSEMLKTRFPFGSSQLTEGRNWPGRQRLSTGMLTVYGPAVPGILLAIC
jgi:hypothetical protein